SCANTHWYHFHQCQRCQSDFIHTLVSSSWPLHVSLQLLASTRWSPPPGLHVGLHLLASTRWSPPPGLHVDLQLLASTRWFPAPGLHTLVSSSWSLGALKYSPSGDNTTLLLLTTAATTITITIIKPADMPTPKEFFTMAALCLASAFAFFCCPIFLERPQQ
ncbi:hypothetical protein OTU49_001970, partial [Cherax quadricarinatus]